MSAFRDVVAAHHADSDAILVAAREPCFSIALDEKRGARGRTVRIVAPEDLAGLRLRESWIAAVLLCPGDDTASIATWASSGKRDPRRIVFYFHADTKPRQALLAWTQAGLPVHATWTVKDWKELHRHFAAAWNVRVFEDFR